MLNEFMVLISEALFYVLGGAMLANTLWVFVWVLFWALVMVSPMAYAIYVRPTRTAAILTLAVFFPSLMIAIGPGIVQSQMLSECETVPVSITTDRVTDQTFTVTQCRFKDNFYGEFGEWRITGAPQYQEND